MLKAGEAYINSGLHEMYGLHPGNTFVADIAGVSLELTVADIAVNAKAASIYVNADQLSERIRIPIGAYNGVLSMEKMKGGIATTKEQRIENLNREAVSSNSSAVINQAIGGLIGAILIFIALYVNLQDNTRDILILHMMGYRTKQIRKTMIDVYMPIVWMVFALTLAPSIFMARSIQKSLSISTNDYMPFGTSIVVILFVFAVLNLIYWFVQALFGLGMKRIIAKEEITEIIYAE
ncbi:hypothetical protein D3C78_731240 [compost metagenome]